MVNEIVLGLHTCSLNMCSTVVVHQRTKQIFG